MCTVVAVFMVRDFQSRSNPGKNDEQAVGRLTGTLVYSLNFQPILLSHVHKMMPDGQQLRDCAIFRSKCFSHC